MIQIFYNPKQSVANNDSFSPSAGKPALVMAQWLNKFPSLKVEDVKPLTNADIALAHDPEFVNGILAGHLSNGFGNTSLEVAESLRYTNGSMVQAALYAYGNKCVTVSPTSGFHHSTYRSAQGFCSFNGLMIAAQKLLLAGANKLAIIDCDMHYGNGTHDIIMQCGLGGRVKHVTFGKAFHDKTQATSYLNYLRKLWTNDWFKDVDIILFQAGADVHVDDPLGGVLDTNQLKVRDSIMFEGAYNANIPLCWNLAGGYATPIQRVLDIHNNTMTECIRVYEKD